MRALLKTVRVLAGSLALLFGVFGILCNYWELYDPLTSRIAFDFGVARSFEEVCVSSAVHAVVVVFGIWLLFSKRWNHKDLAQQSGGEVHG